MKEYHKTVFFSRPLREARKSCRALICCATRKRDGVDAKQSACSNVESTIRPCALLRRLPMFLERRSRTFSCSSLKQTRKCAKLKYKTIERGKPARLTVLSRAYSQLLFLYGFANIFLEVACRVEELFF